MNQTSKLLQAAAALSAVLSKSGVPHAFHGNFLAAVLADNPQSDVCLLYRCRVLLIHTIVGNILHR
jgi:hypothetical protein